MFESQAATGAGYTKTVALLAVALVFIPTVLFFSRPFGYLAASLASAGSVVCLAWAWVGRTKSANLSIPSIARERKAAE